MWIGQNAAILPGVHIGDGAIIAANSIIGSDVSLYENPIEHACDMKRGQVFVANGWQKPENFCDSAWDSISPFVMTLAHGGENFYNGWMKNRKSAMISCNDGFRPVSFLLETMDEEAQQIGIGGGKIL